MSTRIDEVENLVRELKGAIEEEIGQIEAKFESFAREAESGADAERLGRIAGDLRDAIARVKGIVADGQGSGSATEPASNGAATSDADGASASGPVSSDGTDLSTGTSDESASGADGLVTDELGTSVQGTDASPFASADSGAESETTTEE